MKSKRILAQKYQEWGRENGLHFVREPTSTKSNYWLNIALTEDKGQRDRMLEATNKNNVMTRPAWIPMHQLEMNQDCQHGDMENTEWLFDRIVNVPSSVRSHE